MTLRPVRLRQVGINGQLGCGQSDAASWIAASCPRPSKTLSSVRETASLQNRSRFISF